MTTPIPKPAELIAEFIRLRDERKTADARFASFRKDEYDEPMDKIEKQLLDILNKAGVESIRSKSGTASKKLHTSVTTADGAEFRRHIIGAEAWDLVDWKPNKTAINDLIEAGDPLPPGVNRTQTYTISVLKGKE
jgi:DNA-binding Lrp family transcriptional regulator